MKKRKKFLIVFFIFAIILIIILGRQLEKNNQFKDDKIDSANGILTEEEKIDGLKKIKQEIGSKKDKVVLLVNGEEITEKEIADEDFRLNNQYVNKTGQKRDAVEEIIKKYVVYQDAQKQNMSLTDKEKKEIEDRIRNSKETPELAKAFKLSYNEYCEMVIKRTIILEMNSMWHENLLNSISENKLEFYNENFKNKYEEYDKSKDIPTRTQLLTELIDMYKEYLVDQATIKRIE